MKIKGKTDTGIKRAANQDSFFAEKIGDVYLAVVCDGMGGAKGGNIASAKAMEVFVNTFKKLSETNNDYMVIMFTAVAEANDKIYKMAVESPEYHGMGTTIVACVYDGGKLYIINVGDSRLYVINEHELTIKQITKDHSLVQYLIDTGKLTEKEAEFYPKRNVIMRVIGTENTVDVDMYEENYAGSTILLCSDGLYNYISTEDIIKNISAYEDINICLNELINKANENGGGDNITAVLLKP